MTTSSMSSMGTDPRLASHQELVLQAVRWLSMPQLTAREVVLLGGALLLRDVLGRIDAALRRTVGRTLWTGEPGRDFVRVDVPDMQSRIDSVFDLASARAPLGPGRTPGIVGRYPEDPADALDLFFDIVGQRFGTGAVLDARPAGGPRAVSVPDDEVSQVQAAAKALGFDIDWSNKRLDPGERRYGEIITPER